MRSIRGVNVLLAVLIGAAWSMGPGPPSGPTDSQAVEIPPRNVDSCEQVACRDRRFLRLELGDGHKPVPFKVGRMPYVGTDGAIALVPGDSLVFHLAGDGGPPVFVRQNPDGDMLPTAQDAASGGGQIEPNSTEQFPAGTIKVLGSAEQRLAHEPPGTLIVSFAQVPDSAAMVLEIAHNLGQPLRIDASFVRLSRTGLVPDRMSICLIPSGVLQTETWPKALGTMVLEKFTLLPKGTTATACW